MKFTTASGAEFDYNWCGVAFTGVLVISIPNTTPTADIFALGTNPSELATITFKPDAAAPDSNKTLNGYTRFVGIQVNEGENAVHLMLGKEYADV